MKSVGKHIVKADDANQRTRKIQSVSNYVCKIIFLGHSKKLDVWKKGRTHHYRYECMGATTFIQEHVAGRTQSRILDAGCSHGTAIKNCKSFLEDSDHTQ